MNTMRLAFYSLISLIVSFCLGTVSAQADDLDAEPQGWQVSLGIGAGLRTNPVMNNDNIPMVLVPQINYRGERFFLQNLDLGYSLWEDSSHQLNLLLTPSYDQIFFRHWQGATFVSTLEATAEITKDGNQPTVDPLRHFINKRQLRERRMAALGGVEYSFQGGSFDLQVQALHELTNYYDGDELRIAFSKNISLDRSNVKLTVGANWQSAASLGYFYGLTPTEAPGQVYEPEAGISGLIRFDWTYHLTEQWSLKFFTSYRHLSSAIADSPLVTSDNVITAFAGGVYHF